MDFEDRIVVYGDTTFTINKLPAWPDAYRCWEVVRTILEPMVEKASAPELRDFFAGVRDQFAGGGPETSLAERLLSNVVAGKMITLMLAAIPPDKFEDVRVRLFKGIKFEKSGAPKRPLAGSEEHAFEDAAHVYLLFVRAAVINFRESLVEILSPILGDEPSSPQPEP